jgi:hypothetical protein
MKNLRLAMLAAGLLLAACSPADEPASAVNPVPAVIVPVDIVPVSNVPADIVRLPDCQGQRHAPLAATGDAVHVILFISHECPIANGYAPTVRELHEEWSKNSRVRLFLVHVDPDFSAAAARVHAKDYELPGTILMDPEQALARQCGATITPEAIVVSAAGIGYRGRIDDQWRKLGSRAPEASQHDLADAVASVLAGLPVAQPFPKAVGCLLPEPRR